MSWKTKNFKNIPAVLKGRKQWVTWGRNGKDKQGNYYQLKQPFNPVTGKPAKIDDPTTWATYEDCEKAVDKLKYTGLGYVFNEDYIAIDLDNVIDEKGNMLPDVILLLEGLDSYTEYSQSKRGVHVILSKGVINLQKNSGKLPVTTAEAQRFTREGVKVPAIEMYTTGRYFAITGNIYNGKKIIKENTTEARRLYRTYINPVERPEATATIKSKQKPKATLTDKIKALLAVMYRGKNGKKIKKLWEGDISDYKSQSEADLALCNYLAFYTDKKPQAINDAFICSGLYREKWDEARGAKTYGQLTIELALKNFRGRTISTYKKETALA